MEAYFECLMTEPVASVRAILGHFIFFHPSLYGWQWSDSSVYYEQFIRFRWFSLGDYLCIKSK